jgi:hypothetical protein
LYDARPMRALTMALPALLAFALPLPASAWTAVTRAGMVDDAVKLMPKTLRSVLEKRRNELRRGMLEPMTLEDSLSHRPPWEGGDLPASVDAAAADVVSGAATRVSFGDVARRFGVLAHFVADAGFPPGASGAAGAGRYAPFAAFCESRRTRFPFVFYGHDNAALAKDDFKAFTLGILERARAEDANLERAFAAAARSNDPDSFDDRSVPFAVASLSYSRTVTDIVQAWLAAWRLCQGDLGGLPYSGAKK